MRVLVLDGNENQAVAATRSLARAGYTVVVGASEGWSKAGWSRAASGTFVYPSPRDDASSFVDALLNELRVHGEAIIMPMTERTTIPISHRRGELLAAGARLVLPPDDVLRRVFDKAYMNELAKSLGVAVPRTWTLDARASVDALAGELPFPVVLKPMVSEERTAAGGTVATGAPTYARDAVEFARGVAALRARTSSPLLIQEFVLGTGGGYFALMVNGELRGEFAHRRIRDVRPSGSGSALRESVTPSPAMRDASLALLRAVGWHGVAMVEFRVRADGTPVFLEVNGRFWNSLALAVHSGVDFPVGIARIAEHGDTEPLASGISGVRCRWLLGDLRHLAAVWKGAPRGFPVAFPSRLRTTLDVITPSLGTVHDNFSVSDPLPELGDWIHFFGRRVPDALGKLRRRKP